MGLDFPEARKADGLKTALDIIVAPKEAFEQLRRVPTWGWALLLTLVFTAVGSYLATPAVVHGLQTDWPRIVASNPRLEQLTPQQQQGYLAFSVKFAQFGWVFALIFVPIIVLIQAVVMLIFKAIGRGDASFAPLWASAVNIAFPAVGINSLLTAVIVIVRGPESFGSTAEVQTAMPSLALLVPSTAVKLHAFMAAFNPFTLWGLGLTVGAMAIVARVPRAWAWITAIVVLLLSAGLLALGAR